MAFLLKVPAAGEVKFVEKLAHDFPDPDWMIKDTLRVTGNKDLSPEISTQVAKMTSTEISDLVDRNIQKLTESFKRKIRLESNLSVEVGENGAETIQGLERYLLEEKTAAKTFKAAEEQLSKLNSTSSMSTTSFSKTLPKIIPIRLVHEDSEPLLHRRVEIFAKTWFASRSVANGITKRDGCFEFDYDLQNSNNNSLNLCVYEELHPEKGLLSVIGKAVRVVFSLDFIPSESLQTFKVDLYSYPYSYTDSNRSQPHGYLPRLKQPSDSNFRPEQETLDYQLSLAQAGLAPLLKDQVAKFLHDVQQIENLYGVINSGLTLTSKTTVDLLLKGIYPCNFLKSDKYPNDLYLVDIDWSRYAKDNRPVLLPNVKIYLKDHISDCLEVTEVAVKFAGDRSYTVFPNTHAHFSKALYVANAMALVKGEIVSHLGLGHLYTEQNAMAVFRTLRYNPLGLLLKPHLRGVLEINRRGDELIFGPSGILHASKLSLNGIKKSLQDVLRGTCYSNFKPRTPINNQLDHFALAENLYWNIVTTVVDKFFQDNNTEITRYWYEIEALSKCLHEHSLDHRRWEGKEYNAWVSTNEIDQPEAGEPIDSTGSRTGKAVRAIVRNRTSATPDPQDLERLKQFSRHAIFMATFWHWAVHSSQGVWGTNLKIDALAPRDFDAVPYRGVSPADASQQMSLAHTFTNFQRGHAIDNIHGDIYPELIRQLAEQKAAFAGQGFDIEKMFGGVFI